MSKELSGQVAIVTGSGRRTGIGFAIAKELARRGASLVVTDICRRSEPDPEFEASAWSELEAIAEELGQFGAKHLPVKADITNPEDVEALLDQTENTLGPVNIVVNNAGVFIVKPLLDTTVADWEISMKVNALGAFLCSTKAARRSMST